MARKNVEFNSNTMKEPHRIGNTDLYYFQIYNGVNQNGYDSYLDFLDDKVQQTYGDNREIDIDLRNLASNRAEFEQMVASGATTYTSYEDYLQDALILMQRQKKKDSKKRHRTVRNNAWVIYKKDPKDSYEEFVARISRGELKRVGDLSFSPVNQNMQPDSNGNLILKTIASDLENIDGVGDVLVSSDGVVLANGRGTYCIKPVNEYGYYPVDVFKREENPESGDAQTVAIRKNFLDCFGKLISKSSFEQVSAKEQEVIYPINRVFRSTEDKVVKGIYPTSYVHATRHGVDYYPSAAALLIAHKKAVASGKPPIIGANMEQSLIAEVNTRLGVVKGLAQELVARTQSGDKSCVRGSKALIDELVILSDYEQNYQHQIDAETPQS